MDRVRAAEIRHHVGNQDPGRVARREARDEACIAEAAKERQVILDYVEEHPGSPASDVIARGRGSLSRRKAEDLIKEMLYKDPKMLRSEHPEGMHAFGRGAGKLYLISG